MQTNKKTAIEIIILIISLAVAGWLIYNYYQDKTVIPTEEQKEKQRQELADLRAQSGDQPLTDEEISGQIEQLSEMREQTGNNPLTDEEKTAQLEELNKLRSQSQ